MGTLIVGLVILLFVLVSVYTIVHDHKSGIGTCGGNCASCGGCAFHSAPDKNNLHVGYKKGAA